MTQQIGAANAGRTVVTDYAPDQRGLGLIGSLGAVLRAGLDGSNGLITVGDKGRPEQSFNGYAAQRQAFSGQAALASYGAAKPTLPGAASFENTPASLDAFGNDLTLRIYAQRARRRK